MRYLSLLAVLIWSCAPSPPEISTKDKVKTTLQNHFFKQIDDPESFEFVEMSELDTITKKENLEREISIFSLLNENRDATLKRAKELEESAKRLLRYDKNDADAKRGLKLAGEMRENARRSQSKVDSLQNLLNQLENPNGIEHIELYYKFRTNNENGVKNLYRYFVKLNQDLTILSTSQDNG